MRTNPYETQMICTRCGNTKDVCERWSFGVYAGRLCHSCAMKYRDHCGIDQPQGTREEIEALGEVY